MSLIDSAPECGVLVEQPASFDHIEPVFVVLSEPSVRTIRDC
jgi:hypothetical protein